MAAQYSSPTGDQTTGRWSPSPLWDQVNEFVQDSGDLISSSSYPTGDTCEMILSGITAPTDKTAHILSYYYRANDYDTNYKLDLTIGLYQGSTLISGLTYTGITTGWLSGSINLTTGQAATISNYNDLRVRFSAITGSYGGGLIPDVIWYQMNENANITLNDTSSSGLNTGILQSSTQWVNGKSNFGLSGNGTAFFGRTSGNLTIGSAKATICFWLYSTGWGGTPELVELSNNFNSNQNCFICFHDNLLHYGIQSAGYRINNVQLPSTNAWHHYAITLDNSTTTGSANVLIDGNTQAENIELNSKTTTGNFQKDTLYLLSRSGADFSREVMDDFRLYARMLTSGEIIQVLNDPR